MYLAGFKQGSPWNTWQRDGENPTLAVLAMDLCRGRCCCGILKRVECRWEKKTQQCGVQRPIQKVHEKGSIGSLAWSHQASYFNTAVGNEASNVGPMSCSMEPTLEVRSRATVPSFSNKQDHDSFKFEGFVLPALKHDFEWEIESHQVRLTSYATAC